MTGPMKKKKFEVGNAYFALREDGGWEEAEEAGLSAFRAVLSLIVTMVGGGIVALPYVFQLCGVVLGSISLLGICYLSFLGFSAISDVVKATNLYTYEEISYQIHPFYQRILQVILILLLMGATTSYINIGGNVIKSIFIDAGLYFLATERISFLITAALMYPISVVPDFSSLTWVSNACTLGFFVVIAIVLIRCFSIHKAIVENGDREEIKLFAGMRGFSLAMPIIGAAVMAHMNLPPVYGEMNSRSRSRIQAVNAWVSGIAFALYFSVGFIGYLSFKSHTTDDILQTLFYFDSAFKMVDPMVTAAQIILGLVVILKTAFYMLPLRSFLITKLGYKSPCSSVSAVSYFSANHPLKNHLFTIACIGVNYVCAISIPSLSTVLQLTGAICCSYLGFICPGLMELQVFPGSYRAILLIASGVLISCVSMAAMIMESLAPSEI